MQFSLTQICDFIHKKFFDFLYLQENSELKREYALPVKCLVFGKYHYFMGIFVWWSVLQLKWFSDKIMCVY
jgi:hypothetical protein